ncbi:hypothetical protein SAMN05216228_102781 [Rhizobium tibeticum]|uniref:Uncharacterized protein n=1 Tax=Rhizobium tibeticum TaxID=501024 RepID=A0A1H8T7W7_9HYPH|nr:hypothetical protein [Rhizobium tibeticum]SEI14085.1 hypothetical protein RTCCBAU85039_5027 [Rhizobium tibeticum]SEO86664.1 hypothetical protein SAMN05216228_102781 [Rhizobium tibeticum]
MTEADHPADPEPYSENSLRRFTAFSAHNQRHGLVIRFTDANYFAFALFHSPRPPLPRDHCVDAVERAVSQLEVSAFPSTSHRAV